MSTMCAQIIPSVGLTLDSCYLWQLESNTGKMGDIMKRIDRFLTILAGRLEDSKKRDKGSDFVKDHYIEYVGASPL